MKYLGFLLLAFLIFPACGGDSEHSSNGEETEEVQEGIMIFDTYNQKISYCIGLDHARGCYNAYSNPQIAEYFNMREIEAGMIDYLVGNDLRISFFDKDSLIDLYLLEDGTVDDSQVTKNDASYAIGLDEAFTLISSLVGRKIDQTVDVEFMIMGIEEAMQNVEKPTIAYMDAKRQVTKYYGEKNEENGKQFLEENKQFEGIIETETGLQYEIIQEGNGAQPNITDSVTIHYTGRFIDGRVFESTIPSNIPFQGSLMSVIPGWQEGVSYMKEGGQSRLYIPHNLAYGPEGKGVVEPYSTLVFDIELIKVKRFQ